MGIKKIEIVSHRGANEVAPENTLAAAQACIDHGVDYVEVDVWTSRDGVLYVMHDATVDRTTDGSGHLLALTAAEIDQLDAGSWFGPQFQGERVPRLEEFLRWVKGKAKVYFDVKFAHPQQLIDLIVATRFEDECFLWSGTREWMKLFHQLAPHLPLKVNIQDQDGLYLAHKHLAAQIVEVAPSHLNEELISACQRLGVRVMARSEQESLQLFREMLQWPIDMVNLDHPDLFLAALNGHQGESHL